MKKLLILALFIAPMSYAQERTIDAATLMDQQQAVDRAQEMNGVRAVCGCISNEGIAVNVAGPADHASCKAVEGTTYLANNNLVSTILGCGVKYMSATYRAIVPTATPFLPNNQQKPPTKIIERRTESRDSWGGPINNNSGRPGGPRSSMADFQSQASKDYLKRRIDAGPSK